MGEGGGGDGGGGGGGGGGGEVDSHIVINYKNSYQNNWWFSLILQFMNPFSFNNHTYLTHEEKILQQSINCHMIPFYACTSFK